MSNPALLHLPLRGNLDGRDRNGIVTATAVGPVRFTADGYLAEEGTTNLILNPSAEVNATHGISATAGTTVSRDTAAAWAGASSFKTVTAGAGSAEGIVPTISALGYTGAARTFTGSVAVRGSGSVGVWIRATYTDATILDSPSVVVSLTDAWQRTIPASITIDPAKTVSLLQIHVRTSSAQAITFWIDGVQIEEKAYATSYCDGSLGTGYSWAGTAHASASTRQGSALVIDPTGRINLERGEVHVRVAYGPSGETAQYALHHINGTNTRLFLHRILATKKLGIGLGSNGNFANESGSTVDGATVVHGLSWDGTAAIHYKGLAAISTGNVGTGLQTLTSGLGIGGLTSGNAQVNGCISDLMIFDRPLTDAERATLAATPEWSFGVLQPKIGGLLRIGMSMGLAISSVAAPAALGIAREMGGLS